LTTIESFPVTDSSTPEHVYTVRDWYDGPRTGLADFRGAPHHYRSLYLDTDVWNPDEDRFELVPVAHDILASAMEEDAIFQRWDAARQTGEVSDAAEISETEFGALPAEPARYADLQAVLAPFQAPGQPHGFVVRGEFALGCKEVRWSDIASPVV
jgi:hypothetical protein